MKRLMWRPYRTQKFSLAALSDGMRYTYVQWIDAHVTSIVQVLKLRSQEL